MKQSRNLSIKPYGEAINEPVYGSIWKEAIQKTLSALAGFETWNSIPRKETKGTAYLVDGNFDVKCGLDDRIDCLKFRLVARGNEQLDDFNETFELVFQLKKPANFD